MSPRKSTALILASAFAAICAHAQDIPKTQRISTEALRQQVRSRPQGTEVPVDITKRGDDVVLQTADGAVKVANPEVISNRVQQLPAQVVVTPATGGAVEIEGVRLQATKKWEAFQAKDQARYRKLENAQRKLDEAAQKYIGTNSSEEDKRSLAESVDLATKETIQAYQQLPEAQRVEQRELVEQHAELRRLSKSLYGYGRDDRYPPATYEKIYASSPGAFALRGKRDEKPRCSAVLISQRYALTNNHCILEEAADEFDAVFDYDTDLEGNELATKTFPVAAIRMEDDEERGNLDFVVLELGANTEGKFPGDVYRPQCLSLAEPHRDDPLYVIGHPLGDPRTVHDNTFVYFPHRVTPEEYAELKMLVSQEFDSIAAEDASYNDGKLKEFRDSYQLRENGGDPWYEYVSVRFGKQPTIGVDSDTYRGNSGSPVFSRRTHAVIGLLFDGQEDLTQAWEPGWRSHEAVLPITRVVERLDAVMPQWRTDPKSCVKQGT